MRPGGRDGSVAMVRCEPNPARPAGRKIARKAAAGHPASSANTVREGARGGAHAPRHDTPGPYEAEGEARVAEEDLSIMVEKYQCMAAKMGRGPAFEGSAARIPYRCCPLCEGTSTPPFARGDCAHHPPPPTPRSASDMTSRANAGSRREWSSAVARHVASGSWLDVGFGNGSLLFTAEEWGFTPVGIDLRPANVAALRALGFEAHCRDIATFDRPGRFRVISMADVLRAHALPQGGPRRGAAGCSSPTASCSSRCRTRTASSGGSSTPGTQTPTGASSSTIITSAGHVSTGSSKIPASPRSLTASANATGPAWKSSPAPPSSQGPPFEDPLAARSRGPIPRQFRDSRTLTQGNRVVTSRE